MRSISLILAGMVFSVLSTAQDWEIRIDRYLQAQMDTFHIPALSAAIVENGVVIYKRTFGMAVPEFKIRNADTTAFQLASATKLIAATAMMTLVQENKLTKTVYAGGDYAVIMRMIERITGTDYQTFLRRNLLDKLQMNHTGYNNMSQDFIYRTSDVLPFAATVYTWDENTKKQRIFSMMFPSWSYPAGLCRRPG